MISAPPLLPEIDFAYDEVPNLHELIDQLRASGPVVPVTYHGSTVWLINSYKELALAFSDEEHFEAAVGYRQIAEPSMGKTIQTMAGEEHRLNRGLVSKPFFPKQVRSMAQSLLAPVADELLDELEGEEEFDLVARFLRPYPFRIITRILGIPVDDESKLLAWALKLIDFPWDPEGALAARAEFDAYLLPVIEARRAEPGDDVLSTLVTEAFEGQRLHDEEILAFAKMLFPAGSDTTYKLGSSMFATVLADDALRQRAMSSPEGREAIVQEALRHQPATALLPRICSRDTELGGQRIKAGDWMLFGITAANSDPDEFSNPRQFNPDRENRNLAFGQGVHFCLGSHLARAELTSELERVLGRFPGLTIAPGREPQVTGGVLRGVNELWVRPGDRP